MKKTYKKIKAYNGKYGISDKGEVYSFVGGNCKILKFNMVKGYKTIALVKEYKLKRFLIHRLVYEAFKGYIQTGMQINHIDGNKLNNDISNLEVNTPKENTNHAWNTGLCTKKIGEQTNNSKFTMNQVKEIKKLGKEGVLQKIIAKQFNCHSTNIHYILSGKTWKHA